MTAPEAEVTELPSSPGARLRREREVRELTEQQAGEALNLDPTVVIALESNDYASLGAPVFVKGHLRRYAAWLELDADEIVGGYERSRQQIDEPTLVPKSRLEMPPERERAHLPWVIGGIAAFLVAAIVAAWVSERGLPWAQEQDSTAPASSPSPSPSLAIDPPAAAVTSPAATAPAALPAGGGESGVPPAVAPVATEATTPPAAAATVPGQSAPVTTPRAAPGPGQISVEFRFAAESWVEVFDGAGKSVLYDLAAAGSQRTLTATAPLSVTLGNAPAVTLVVNGRTLVPPRGQGTVARFGIGPDGALR